MRGKGVIYGTQLIFTSDHRLTSLEYTYIKALFIANKIKIMELCKKKISQSYRRKRFLLAFGQIVVVLWAGFIAESRFQN